MAAASNTRLCLGTIAGVQGVRGEVRIRTFTEVPNDIASYGVLKDETGARSFEIIAVRPHKDTMVVARLAGIENREEAAALKGVDLFIDRDHLPEQTEEDVWYYSDLIGLMGVGQDGTVLGEVVAVQNFGAGDLLEVRLMNSSQTVLIPFTEEVVPNVDIPAGEVTIIAPEGLLD
ncbi:ribosome maturation factor RimM [bacterium MnTg02]|nr:ribosome maturation factor RimM [bacterium MnTg02]